MIEAASDEEFLLAVLNSTPVIDGQPADELADPARLASAGGTGPQAELRHVLQARGPFRRSCAATSRRPCSPRS